MHEHPLAVVATPVRRPAALVGVVAGVVLTILSVRYAGLDGPGGVEAHVDSRIQSAFAPYQPQLLDLVRLAEPYSVACISGLIALAALLLRRGRLAILACLGPSATGAAVLILKPTIGRTLDDGLALPSGHTAGMTAMAAVAALTVISLDQARHRPLVALATAGTVVAGTSMGTALIATGLHVLTDVVAGFCTAVLAVLVAAFAIDATAQLFMNGRRHHTR